MKSIFKKSLYLIMVFCLLFLCVGLTAKVSAADEASGEWKLVTDAADLNIGDKVIIVSISSKKAMSTTQKGNNRGEEAVAINDDVCTITDNVQQLTLEKGTTDGTFAFNTGSGYLYAASKSSNYLKTEAKLTDNSSWTISIESNDATIKAQGTNTRNLMRYNSNNNIFSCYGSGQQPISLFKFAEVQEDNKHVVSFESNGGTVVSNQKVDDNAKATIPTEPTKAGYEFVGWFTEADEAFDFSTQITSDITLYAKWKEISWYNYSLLETNASLNISYSTKSSVSSVKYFEKVTEALEDYSGTYLIVYEAGKKAFNGVDAANANITVDFEEDNTIILDEENSTCTVLIEKMNGGYAIKVLEGTNKGKYTSGTNNSNKLNFESSQSLNTIEILEDGSAKITSNTSVLRFNSDSGQERFRYFKSSSYTGQQSVALYKLSDNEKTSTTESFTFANASLRFGIINLPVSEYEKLVAEKAEFGIAIAKGETVDLDTAKKVVCTPVRVNANGEEDASGEFYQFAVVIDDITEADYDKEVTGVAYVKIGEEYHTVQESKTFSVKTIAKYYVDLYNASTTSEDVKAALEQHIDALKALAY